jgi:hypothetical protein
MSRFHSFLKCMGAILIATISLLLALHREGGLQVMWSFNAVGWTVLAASETPR